MKTLIAGLMLLSASAFAGRVEGHIHFQADSTWVNAYYNKTLCVDGDMFNATVTKCLEWERDGDDRVCATRGKVAISQPMSSTRQRCASYSDDNCSSYETVSYEQSRNVTVRFFNNSDDVVRTKTITVPNCQ